MQHFQVNFIEIKEQRTENKELDLYSKTSCTIRRVVIRQIFTKKEFYVGRSCCLSSKTFYNALISSLYQIEKYMSRSGNRSFDRRLRLKNLHPSAAAAQPLGLHLYIQAIILNIITMIPQFTLHSGVYERCLYSILIYLCSNANAHSENKCQWQNNKIYSKMMKECRQKQRDGNYLGRKTVVY